MCCASEAIGGDPLPQSLSLVASCSCKTAVTHRIRYYSWLCLFRNSLLEAFSNPKVDRASSIIGRKRKGSIIYIAVFSSLEPGDYTVHTDSQEFVTKVSILPGRVAEVDWR